MGLVRITSPKIEKLAFYRCKTVQKIINLNRFVQPAFYSVCIFLALKTFQFVLSLLKTSKKLHNLYSLFM